MASRLTKDGIKLSQSSDLATTSASVSVPLNLDVGSYWNFSSVYTASSNASSTPTVEQLRETANWNTGVSSNLVVTFTHVNSTAASRNIGGIEILANNGSDGLSTVKDVKLEVSSDAVNYTTVVDNLELPSTSSSKPAYILLPTEFLGSIGHPFKNNGNPPVGYNHFRLTIKNGYSSDSIKISKILLRPTTLKTDLTSVSSKPAVFNSNTSLIAGGEISSTDVNIQATTQGLDDFLAGLQIDIAANTAAISSTNTSISSLSMSSFTTNLFLDTSLHNVIGGSGVTYTYGPTGSGATHEVAAFTGFKTNSTYTSQHKLAFYAAYNGYSEIIISDLIAINPSNSGTSTRLYFGYDDQRQMDDGQYAYFNGNDLYIVNTVASFSGFSNTISKFYRIDIIR